MMELDLFIAFVCPASHLKICLLRSRAYLSCYKCYKCYNIDNQ